LAEVGLKKNEVLEGWRKQHNEELQNLYNSPYNIRMIKSKNISWDGGGGVGHESHVAKT
jgi:hypothetical protein